MKTEVVSQIGYQLLGSFYDSVLDCFIEVCNTVCYRTYYEDGYPVDSNEIECQDAIEFIDTDNLHYVEDEIVSARLKAVGYTDVFMRPVGFVNFLDDSDDGLPF